MQKTPFRQFKQPDVTVLYGIAVLLQIYAAGFGYITIRCWTRRPHHFYMYFDTITKYSQVGVSDFLA
jgi:hypothetical protein